MIRIMSKPRIHVMRLLIAIVLALPVLIPAPALAAEDCAAVTKPGSIRLLTAKVFICWRLMRDLRLATMVTSILSSDFG